MGTLIALEKAQENTKTPRYLMIQTMELMVDMQEKRIRLE